jgi:hypothetical protein
MNPNYRDLFYKFFYQKDYDSKIGKNSNVLADELYTFIQPHLPVVKPPEPKPEEYCTIGGVKYKLEEIK